MMFWIESDQNLGIVEFRVRLQVLDDWSDVKTRVGCALTLYLRSHLYKYFCI